MSFEPQWVNLSNAEAISIQSTRTFWKPSKPCNVGIHWIAIAEYYQMSTMCQGFSHSLKVFFASSCDDQIRHQQHKLSEGRRYHGDNKVVTVTASADETAWTRS